MSNGYRDLHGDAYQEWKEDAADEFAALQHHAFLAGFEAAADESKEFRHLRNWLEEQRDEAAERADDDNMMFARRNAFSEVLVKLHEMGNAPEGE